MPWRDFFKSSHTLYLEKEVNRLHSFYTAFIADLKSAHAAERDRDISEISRLRSELDRLRLHLRLGPPEGRVPQASTESVADDQRQGKSELSYGGTPWQRVLQREMLAQEQTAKVIVKPLAVETPATPPPDSVAATP